MPTVIPPNPPKAVADVLAELDRLDAQRTQARQAQDQARTAHREAPDIDRRARAAALRSGADDPGTPATDATKSAVTEADEYVAVIAEAIDQAEYDLWVAAEKAAPAWRAKVVVGRPEALRRLEKAVDDLEAAATEVSISYTTEGWLDRLARGDRVNFKGGAGLVHGLRGPSGDPMSVAAVAAALRSMAQPRPKPEPVADGPAAA